MRKRLIAIVLFVIGFAASPALAQTAVSIPEPSSLVLFGLGVAGVVIGRQHGRSPSR